jgi:hypothetical protein
MFVSEHELTRFIKYQVHLKASIRHSSIFNNLDLRTVGALQTIIGPNETTARKADETKMKEHSSLILNSTI